MADQAPQSMQNHTRFDPPFHFVLIPIFAIHFLYRIYALVRHFIKTDDTSDPLELAGWAVLAFGFLLLTFKARLYALKVQDRVIRLEERIRLSAILPETLRTRIPELTERQLIALRFAPDAELTDLVRTALDKNLPPKEIKQAIRNWRPDYWRV